MIQTCSVYLNVFHPFASLYENRLCIHRQSQELHCVDSPWNGSEQSLIALAATVSLLALSIIISNLPDQIAALCRVDITTSLIAILKPSFHSSLSLLPTSPPPCLAWRPILIEMKQFLRCLQRYLDVACGMSWALTEPQNVCIPPFFPSPLPLTVADEINLTPRPEINTGKETVHWKVEWKTRLRHHHHHFFFSGCISMSRVWEV